MRIIFILIFLVSTTFQQFHSGLSSKYPSRCDDESSDNKGDFYSDNEADDLNEEGSYKPNLCSEEHLSSKLKSKYLIVRPCVAKGCPAIHVNVSLKITQILGLMWNDPRLKWSNKDFPNVNATHKMANEVWMPDIAIMNSKTSEDFDFSVKNRHGRVKVNHQGNVEWYQGVILDITCPLEVQFFPFDFQTCYIIVAPWSSNNKQYVLKYANDTNNTLVENHYLPNSNVSEWEIIGFNISQREYNYSGEIYEYIKISLFLKRQPLYFVVLVLVPFSMLATLACLIFTLDDTGDRLSVALSLVLSMTMYVVIVSTNAPRSMRKIPVMGVFLLNQLGLLSIATILAVINNKLHQSRGLHTFGDWLYAISGHGGLGALVPYRERQRLKMMNQKSNSGDYNGFKMEERFNEHFKEYFAEECLPSIIKNRKNRKFYRRESSSELSEDEGSILFYKNNEHKRKDSKENNFKSEFSMINANNVQNYSNSSKNIYKMSKTVNKEYHPWVQMKPNHDRDAAITKAILVAMAENGYDTSKFDSKLLLDAINMKFNELDYEDSPPFQAAKLAASVVTAALKSRKLTNKKHNNRSSYQYMKKGHHKTREEFPYRRIASYLDCAEMIGYLLLSCLNALNSLFMQPMYNQENPVGPLNISSYENQTIF